MEISEYEMITTDNHGYIKKLRYYGNENIIIEQTDQKNKKIHMVISRHILETFIRMIKV